MIRWSFVSAVKRPYFIHSGQVGRWSYFNRSSGRRSKTISPFVPGKYFLPSLAIREYVQKSTSRLMNLLVGC
jgi:hypothetical protein